MAVRDPVTPRVRHLEGERLGIEHRDVEHAGVRRRWLGRRAVAALEFALVAPVFLLFLFAILGVGVLGLYQRVLDEAVRNAARQVQLGGPASQNGASLVAAICQEFTLDAACSTSISYYVQSNSNSSLWASIVPVALPSSGKYSDGFQSCGANNNVLIQVAYPMPFLLPFIGLAVTFTGTNSIVAVTTVRVEPHA